MAADQIEPMGALAFPRDDASVERFCKEKLAELHREYSERCQPFIDVLVKLEMAKPPKPVITGDHVYYLSEVPKKEMLDGR